ncbi:MAG TPA: hypothetical protein VLD19_18745, partial [Chitinophagaceae bacterium]|nr:hypothetical protein [Chitinophagaceae bacterium]
GLDAGGAYQYMSQWSGIRDYNGNPMLYNGVVPMVSQHAVNQDYQWQENKKIDIDLSMGFLKDRITLTLGWYNDRCNNQLTTLPTAAFTGFSSVLGNSPANVENTGWEGSINANLVKSKDFSWSMNFNIAINKNKLVDYPNFQFSPYYLTKKIGQSLNTNYVLHYLGINPQNGRRSYEDYNHDGIITQSGSVPPGTVNDDRYVAIDITPKYSGGLSNQFAYKGIMLNLFFVFKKQIGALPYTTAAGSMGNIPTYLMDNRWQKPGDQATNPRLTTLSTTSDFQFAASDGAYGDNSFIRLSSLALGYSLPESTCKKLRTQGITLSVNASNLFFITRYKGIDPEIAFGSLPQPRVIAGRISFNF